MMRLVGSEADLYEQIARYLSLTHPELVWHFDLAGVNNPSRYTRALYGRLNARAWPDLFIAKPSECLVTGLGDDGDCSAVQTVYGLFLELKRDGARVYLKDGSISKERHIFEQWVVLQQLRQLGYEADFGIGFDDTVEKIELYLEQNV